VQERALQEGLLLLSCGVYGNVIRFLYPLTIPEVQFRKALDIISASLTRKPLPGETLPGLSYIHFKLAIPKS
jgi:acetylornithine/succinyldiaminopimelate/putrescine aminotransferase